MRADATCTVCEAHAESVFRVDRMERRLKHLQGLEDLSADLIGQRLLVERRRAEMFHIGLHHRGPALRRDEMGEGER